MAWALGKAPWGNSIDPYGEPTSWQALTEYLAYRTQRDTVPQEIHSLVGYLAIHIQPVML